MDHYEGWRALLRGEKVGIHEIEPMCGFFRTKASKDAKEYVGVAIWPSDQSEGEFVAKLGSKLVPVERVWPFCAKRPVTEDAYRAWESTGVWPDDHVPSGAPPSAPGIGHNEPEDELDTLRDQIDSASADVDEYENIENDEKSAKAQSLRARLLELSREADRLRKDEKEPHLEAGRAVDAKFNPLVKAAKAAADKLAKAMGAWETAKARAAAEAQRKAEEKRRKAEAEAAKGKPAPEPEPVPEAPAPSTQISGAYGRAAHVNVVNVITKVTDWQALFGFLKDHPELQAKMRKLAQRAVDKGFDVPGVKVEEQRKVV